MKTLADVLSQPALAQLAREYSENKTGQGLVFFIGSGLSRSAGLPDWVELRATLTKEANRIVAVNAISESKLRPLSDRLATTADPWEAFSLLREILGKTSFSNRIIDLLRSDEISPPNLYKRLCQLDLKGIISLNIDDLLVRALASSTSLPVNAVYGKSINDKLDLLLREKPYIYQPHGYIASESSWVFTKEDLEELLSSALHDEFISATFLFNTVVFLGISADDIGASHRLVNLRERGLSTRSHYWIATDSHVEKRSWAEENGVQQILYPSALGHEPCISAILDYVQSYRSYDQVERKPVIGKFEVISEKWISPEELYKLENIDEIRLSLNYLIQSHLDENGEVDYQEYQKFCKQYARSIHASYMMPTNEEGDNSWFGYKITGPALGGKTIGRVFPGINKAGE